MNSKITIVLVLVAVVLAGGIWVYSNKEDAASAAAAKPGTKIFPDLPVNDITKFTMRDADNSITVEKKGGEWVITDLYNYPAQYDRVYAVLKNMDDLTVGQKIPARPSSLGRLSLGDPDDKSLSPGQSGTLITAYTKDGSTVAACVAGKVKMAKSNPNIPYMYAPNKDGQYVKLPDEDSVYLVSQVFELDKKPENWIDRELIAVSKDQVKTMSVMNPAGASFVISHTNGTVPFVLGDLKESEQLNAKAVDTLADSLAYFGAQSIVDPAVAATNTVLETAWTITAEKFDGTLYTVTLSDASQAGTYAQIGVTFSTPVPDPSITNKTSRLKLEEASYEFQDKARLLNDEMAAWTYVIPAQEATRLRKIRSDVVAPKTEEKKDPTE